MSLKKGGGPKTLPVTLTIKGQGSVDKLHVVYHNRKASETRELLNSGKSLGQIVPFIVESWDTDFELTEEGVAAMEDEYPGMVAALVDGYYTARRKEVEGN